MLKPLHDKTRIGDANRVLGAEHIAVVIKGGLTKNLNFGVAELLIPALKPGSGA